MRAHQDRSTATAYARELAVLVEPVRARYSTWYELFPRSTGLRGAHGTFKDVERLVPEIAAMGFDVLYLPPIHPVGRAHRKGPNNTLHPRPVDPGSPYAIGSEEGGHDAVHPDLGTIEDFRSFREAAEAAKDGCPISQALKGNVALSVEATLEEG